MLINDKQGGRVAIEERFDTVLAAAESHVSNIAQPNLLAFGSGGDNDVAELLRIVDLGRHGHRIGISHVARSGFPAELARRKDAALRFDSRKNLVERDLVVIQQVGLQPDTHGVFTGAHNVHLTYAVDLQQFVLDVDIGVVGEKIAGVASGRW